MKNMFNRTITITCVSLLLFGSLALPVSAQGESWSVGGGYWSLPGVSGTKDTSGFYASAIIRSAVYLMEIDYAIDDPGFLALSADYLYPLDMGGSYTGGVGYLGAGYTYFSCDDLSNESGFNAMLGADFGQSLFGTIRYAFLGSDQELITIGVTYTFR